MSNYLDLANLVREDPRSDLHEAKQLKISTFLNYLSN